MRGASVEFHALSERESGGVVTVERAALIGIGVVDSAAYSDSLIEARAEIRQAGRGLEGAFFYDVDRVIRDRDAMDLVQGAELRASRKQRVSAGAFRFAITAPDREIQLLLGPDYGQPLASKQAGTLAIDDGDDALRFSVDLLPETSYVSDFRASLDSGAAVYGVQPLYRVPPPGVVSNAIEEIPEPGNPGVSIEVVNEAVLTAIAVVSRPPRGNPGSISLRGAECTGTERRRLWL